MQRWGEPDIYQSLPITLTKLNITNVYRYE